jgi:FKBP12-rapamycin complex-associated protein
MLDRSNGMSVYMSVCGMYSCPSIYTYVYAIYNTPPPSIHTHTRSHAGKIIHIDFGDCFEVAMLREKVPERVPFRLTRMLVRAMEVCTAVCV